MVATKETKSGPRTVSNIVLIPKQISMGLKGMSSFLYPSPGVAPVLQSSGIENFRPRDAANDPNTSLTQVLTSEKYGRIDSPQPTER